MPKGEESGQKLSEMMSELRENEKGEKVVVRKEKEFSKNEFLGFET